ncbi:MAG: PQQ-binding-like beta-propeller repeat protein [Desulfotignum sp.]|nr:PQQ-binding-like beta-propeller repeat protein [Desulfotignum sp.]MCF8136226.1 PQQ-binding-like beta-propeller repeat protein [Desulfotignum sp.]
MVLLFLVFGVWMPQSVRAAEVGVELVKGWNLINSPLQLADTGVAAVLAGVWGDTTSVWKWQDGNWAVCLPGEDKAGAYAQSKGFAPLTAIEAGQGFWVNNEKAATLVLQGDYSTPPTLNLSAGWNLVGLRSSQGAAVDDLFATVSSKVTSAWAWQGDTWAVHLFGDQAESQAYAESKGFGVLDTIGPCEGVWVNAAADTGTFPPLSLAGKVLAKVSGRLTPVPGASIYKNGVKIAESDHDGLFSYQSTTGTEITIQAPGFAALTGGYLAAGTGRSLYLLHEKESDDLPEPLFDGQDDLLLGKVKAAGEPFKEYPNLFIMEASQAEEAKATPKVIHNTSAALTITDMALTKDVTAALVTFQQMTGIPDYETIETLLGASQSSLLVGGAQVLLSDSLGEATSSEAAGFSGKVRATLKGVNLSADKMSLTEMQTALGAGLGAIYLFAHLDETEGEGKQWQLVGRGTIAGENGDLVVHGGPGVVMDGLHSFVFLFGGQKAVNGSVVDVDGQPVADAMVTLRGADELTVTKADGSFQLGIPDLLSEASLIVHHEAYYRGGALATFTGEEDSVTVDPITLTSLTRVDIEGSAQDHLGQPLAEAEVHLRFAGIPPQIIYPADLKTDSDDTGAYHFPKVPADLLAGAVVDIVTAKGYDPLLARSLPEPVAGVVTLDITVVTPLWFHQTGGNLYGSPVVAGDSVYFGGVDGRVYCLATADGGLKWSFDSGRPIFGSPALDENHLYIATLNNGLCALNKATGEGADGWYSDTVNPFPGAGNHDFVTTPVINGTVLSLGGNDNGVYFFDTGGWALNSDYLTANITGSAALAGDNIHFGCWDGYFYAFGAGGGVNNLSIKWQFPAADQAPLPARILSTPLAADGRLYFGGGNNLTVTLFDDDGEESVYPFTTTDDHQTVVFSPQVASHTITVDQEDKTLYVLDADDGTLLWSLELDGAVVGRPALVGETTLLVSTLNGTLTAFDITSAPGTSPTTLWSFTAAGPIYSAPVVAGGKVYVGSEDTHLYCLDAATGKQQWAMKTAGPIIATPAVAAGRIYAASLDGALYVVAE